MMNISEASNYVVQNYKFKVSLFHFSTINIYELKSDMAGPLWLIKDVYM